MLSVHTLQTVSQPLKDPGSCIVPPGVSFELSCPICKQPFKLGQYYTHYWNITILCCDIEDPLKDHLCQPFRRLRNIHFTKPDNDQRLNLSDQENIPPYPSLPPPPSYCDASPSSASPQEPISNRQGQLHIHQGQHRRELRIHGAARCAAQQGARSTSNDEFMLRSI